MRRDTINVQVNNVNSFWEDLHSNPNVKRQELKLRSSGKVLHCFAFVNLVSGP
ncbi:hypothetical protein E2562_009583 [Oryza meyeriana var. granulata]|uniref:Uncharacterized protein n=1 Tax=Oryza meyeriana var. granulata TaxID=110450 RepID=A0A6G1F633_9ORYZ|nr:hypothetical protein E2562_009583 [Oryza meyeriana var. granulata]